MRKTVISFVCGVLVTVILVSVTSCFGTIKRTNNTDTVYQSAEEKLAEMREIIDEYAIEEFDEKKAEEGLYYGYMLGLKDDNYATYYTAEEYESVINDMSGQFGGIGLQFYNYATATLEKGLFVYRVLGNSPAESAGLSIGDIITDVNGKSLVGMTYSDAYNYVVEFVNNGQTVELTVLRDGKNLNFSLTPEHFTQRYVDYKILDGNIGCVNIYQFGTNSVNELREALTALEEAGVVGYIFDVRDDPGGELQSVCTMVDMLVEKGETIITIESKNSTETTTASEDPIVSGKPIAVVVNGSTASAAEMFSSSLRDLNGAKLVGTKTFGKGIGQTTRRLSDGSYIKFTTFKYFTAAHIDFNGIGLTPDIEIELPNDKKAELYALTLEEDTQLYAAWESVKAEVNK